MHRVGFVAAGLFSAVLLGVFWHAGSGAAANSSGKAADAAGRTPVLVELFTSEGCSDCPPADELLEKLDKSQPVPGANLVVLSEHVDYWNRLGWKDPYSSSQYSERQSDFGRQFSLDSVYTPQMVVDGSYQFVGSDSSGAVRAIKAAAKEEKIPVTLSSVHFDGHDKVTVHIETGAPPSTLSGKSLKVFLVAADDSDESQVSRGENAGRSLRHVGVARTFAAVGSLDKATGYSQDVQIRASSANARTTRLVAFLQEESTGRIWGVGTARASN